jgi:hypothetical protein
VALAEDLAQIAAAAEKRAEPGETLAAVLVSEAAAGERTYVCAYESGRGRAWIALDANGAPITVRTRVRDAVSIAALCELAEDGSGVMRSEPRVASPQYLDEMGRAGDFAATMQQALSAVDELANEVERSYKLPLT